MCYFIGNKKVPPSFTKKIEYLRFHPAQPKQVNVKFIPLFFISLAWITENAENLFESVTSP